MSFNSAAGAMNSEEEVKTEIRIVPWRTAEQFRKVYNYLYSPDITKKSWALDQILVWRTRCHPGLPAAITSSLVFTSAFVNDSLWMDGNALSRQNDIEMLYAAAIEQFLSWIKDSHIDQFKTQGLTMAQVLKGLGIPTYVADVRNECSHSRTPSLPYLRLAAVDSMDYLKRTYWEVEVAQVKNLIKKRPDVKESQELISRFMTAKLKAMRDKEKMTARQQTLQESTIKKYLQAMDELIEKDKNLFIKALTMDGFFIPHDEELKHFVNNETFLLFQEAFNPEAEGSEIPTPIGSIPIPDVPELHEALWEPVIGLLNGNDEVPLFMEELLTSQDKRTVAGQKLIVAWVLKILRIHSDKEIDMEKVKESALCDIFMYRPIVVNWYSLFRSSLDNPTVYTSFIFPLILCNMNITQGMVQYFMQLYAIRVGLTTSEKDKPLTGRIYTVTDLIIARQNRDAERGMLTEPEEVSIWIFPEEEDYQVWPIATVIDPVLEEEEENMEEDDEKPEEEKPQVQYIESNENDTEEHYYDDEVYTGRKLPAKMHKGLMVQMESESQSLVYKI